MKMIFLFFLSFALIPASIAQLKVKAKCADFEVDILDGKVNGEIKADHEDVRIKYLLPCFTSSAEQKDSTKCGAGVFYKDRDIYFFTERDYIEIGPNFKGKLSIPLLAAPRNLLFKALGNPKLKDVNWEAYQTTYGMLVLHFDSSNKVKTIRMTTLGPERLSICE